MPIPSSRTYASDLSVTPGPEGSARVHAVSVVVPVYRGEETIAALVGELDKLGEPVTTPAGATFRVDEIVLVHDHGPDRSDVVLQELAATYPQVRVVWLSRNYGQDAATIAGMAEAKGDWTVTMDEDGQHDPAFIADFLDAALAQRADLVYSKPVNTRPHGFLRNITSRGAKIVLATVFAFPDSTRFESYRLIRGDIARQLAQVASNGVYLDVALTWVVGDVAQVPVQLRAEGREESGYNYRRLFSLFWKMVLCSGTRGLRLVSMLGVTLALGGLGMAGWVVYHALTNSGRDPEGWASLMTVLLLCSGAVLFSLGLIAEYLGVALHVLVGKPLYLTVQTPTPRPRELGRDNDNVRADDTRYEPAARGNHAREQ